MVIEETEIAGLLVIRPRVFEDGRGYFLETFSKRLFEQMGVGLDIVQSNLSCSQAGVVRGLHYQNPPHAQGKLVRVLRGAVLDVALDIRKNSPTFGRHISMVLSEANKLAMWVPPGFAHGFRTLADDTLFYYDCTGYYHKDSEGCIRWDDPALGIDWGISGPILSEKDAQAPLFKDCNALF